MFLPNTLVLTSPILLWSPLVSAMGYPVGISNCHLSSWFDKAPERTLVASSGALEIMLAMGLSDRIVASCWVEEVWEPLQEDFDKFTHFPEYPTQEEIFGELKPDFIYATYSSAFEASTINYTQGLGVESCSLVVESNVYGQNKSYCRQELHDAGILTYLQTTYCELVENRPETISVDVLYQEIWEIGRIFNTLDKSSSLIDGIEDHFAQAIAISHAGTSDASAVEPLRVFWLDTWNSTDEDTGEMAPYVGACCGGPQVILDHAGAVNVFADRGVEDRRIWDQVSWIDVVASDPDLIVLIELSDESAAKKLFHLCNDTSTRNMRAVQERSFLVVPFAATNLGVRLGALAYNFAEAMASLARGVPLNALQFSVDEETLEATSLSGAKVWTTLPTYDGIDLNTFCPGVPKAINVQEIEREDEEQTNQKSDGFPSWAIAMIAVFGVLVVSASLFLVFVVRREKKGDPMFAPILSTNVESA